MMVLPGEDGRSSIHLGATGTLGGLDEGFDGIGDGVEEWSRREGETEDASCEGEPGDRKDSNLDAVWRERGINAGVSFGLIVESTIGREGLTTQPSFALPPDRPRPRRRVERSWSVKTYESSA